MAFVRSAGAFGATFNRHSLGPTPGAEAMTLHSSASAGTCCSSFAKPIVDCKPSRQQKIAIATHCYTSKALGTQ